MTSLQANDSSAGLCSSCIDMLLQDEKCLAYALWRPFYMIAYNPIYSLLVLIVLYLVFCVIFLPFLLLSYVLTDCGSLAVFILLIWLGARAFARSMAFAGGTNSVKRELSLDYMRRLVANIARFSVMTSNFAITVANSDKTRQRLSSRDSSDGGMMGRRNSGSSNSGKGGKDSAFRKAKELQNWLKEMGRLCSYIDEAIEDYRFRAYSSDKRATRIKARGRRGLYKQPDKYNQSTLPKGLNIDMDEDDSNGSMHSVGFEASKPGGSLSAFLSRWKHQWTEYFCGVNKITKEEVDAVLNPVITVKDHLSSLLEQTSLLVNLTLEKNNSAEEELLREKMSFRNSPHAPHGNNYSTADAEKTAVAEVVASIGLCIRYGESLRSSLSYMLEQSMYESDKSGQSTMQEMRNFAAAETQGGVATVLAGAAANDAAQSSSTAQAHKRNNSSSSSSSSSSAGNGSCGGNSSEASAASSNLLPGLPSIPGLDSLVRLRQGPRGPSNLSFFIMRSQLVGDHKGHWFDVEGEDGNLIDCMYFAASDFNIARAQDSGSSGEDEEEGHAVPDPSPSTPPRAGSGAMNGNESTSLLFKRERTSSYHSNSSTGGPRSRSWSGGISRPALSSVGTVLFCGPNAGVYEYFSVASHSASWLGYYTQRGLDVCFFNYRGFSLSSGVADPHTAQVDGESVLRHIRDHFGVRRLILHGESIGGLVATHLAAKYSPAHQSGGTKPSNASHHDVTAGDGDDIELGLLGTNLAKPLEITMLVCDRTFASLEAAASRILGAWAGYGLRYLGGWDTECARKYVESEVPMKVILQDPNDMVIHHAASLKYGVANYKHNHDSHHLPKAMLSEYALANFRGLSPKPLEALVQDSTSLMLDGDQFASAFASAFISLLQQARQVSAPSGASQRGSVSLKSYKPNINWLGAFCQQKPSKENRSLNLLEKAWLCLARMEGGTGILLAQSLWQSFDGMRGFLSSVVVWQGRTLISTKKSVGVYGIARSAHQCLQDLDDVIVQGSQESSFGDIDIAKNTNVLFLRKATKALCDRIDQHKSALETQPSSRLRGGNGDLGYLVHLNCGHSGWPGKHVLTGLELLLVNADIPITKVLIPAKVPVQGKSFGSPSAVKGVDSVPHTTSDHSVMLRQFFPIN